MSCESNGVEASEEVATVAGDATTVAGGAAAGVVAMAGGAMETGGDTGYSVDDPAFLVVAEEILERVPHRLRRSTGLHDDIEYVH